MRCSQCGTEVADGLSSCPACGVAFEDAGRPAGGSSGQSENSSTPQGGQPTQSTGGRGGHPHSGGQGQSPSGGQGRPQSDSPGQAPSGGQGQSTPGGQSSPRGGQGRTGGQPSPQGHTTGQQPHQSQQPRQASQSHGTNEGLGAIYAAYLADLPVVGGVVAGALIYVVGFLVTAAVGFVVVEVAGGTVELDILAELFYNAHFTTLGSVDVSFSQLPATLGVAFVFVPYMLFVAGARFGRWQAHDGMEPLEAVLAGATVIAGYLPAIAVGTALLTPGADTFPPRYGSILLTAGVLYPVVCGGLGGATSYFFGEFGGIRARTTGALLGVAGFLATYGVAFVSVDSSVQSELLTLGLVSTTTYIAGHLFAIAADAEGLWFLVMLIPVLLVAVTGYLRARRADVTEWIDGVRAGASIAFGYAAVALFALLVMAVQQDFASEIMSELNGASLRALAQATDQITLSARLSPPQFVEWFVVAGLCYPLVIGSCGGLLHVIFQRTLSKSASETASS